MSLPKLRIIRLNGIPILRQLRLEETLLRCSTDNFLVLNEKMPGKSIVMGFSAKPAELLELEKVQRDKVEVLRRYTGGGTVIVDNNTVFTSLILNSKDVPSAPYPREIMQWTATVFEPTFACSASPAAAHLPPFELRENDYVMGDRKIAGNAQTITKDRWVHHTSWLWAFTAENMQYLQLPKKRPEYRQGRPHTDFLAPLHDRVQSVDKFFDCLVQSVGNSFEISEVDTRTLPEMYTSLCASNPKFTPRTKVEDPLPPISL